MSLKVNGEEITPADIELEYRRLERAYLTRMTPEAAASQQPKMRQLACKYAIGRRLLLQEARRRDLTVPETELAEGLRLTIAGAGGPAAWTAALRAKEIDYQNVLKELNENLLVEQLTRQIVQAVAPPTENEVTYHSALNDNEHYELTTADERREQLRAHLHAERRNQALEAFVEQLRNDALIETDDNHPVSEPGI